MYIAGLTQFTDHARNLPERLHPHDHCKSCDKRLLVVAMSWFDISWYGRKNEFYSVFRFLAFSSIPYSENRHKRLSMADAFAPFASPVITAGRAGVTGVVSVLKYVLSDCRTCEIGIENRTEVALSDAKWYKHCGRSSGTPPSPTIQPHATKTMKFSKSFGLLGCSGLLSYQYTSTGTRFVIAFRISMEQLRERKRNLFAITSMEKGVKLDRDLYKNMMHEWDCNRSEFQRDFAGSGNQIRITTNGVEMACTMSSSNRGGIRFEISPEDSFTLSMYS